MRQNELGFPGMGSSGKQDAALESVYVYWMVVGLDLNGHFKGPKEKHKLARVLRELSTPSLPWMKSDKLLRSNTYTYINTMVYVI